MLVQKKENMEVYTVVVFSTKYGLQDAGKFIREYMI